MSSESQKEIQQYSKEYLEFNFIPTIHNEQLYFPFCVNELTNESMKEDCLEAHLKSKYIDHFNSDLNHFQTLKKIFVKRATLKSI